MLNSRDIDKLRPDVAANCRTFLGLCKGAGLNVLIAGTVRDKEYQEHCYRTGASKTPTPSFHAQGIGLAFDFCKNVKGQEYADLEFFQRAGTIGKKLGFTWGGDWASFPDRPHLQWDQGGRYTSSMILSGKRPPQMPQYEEECDMTKDEVQAMVDAAVKLAVADYEEGVGAAQNRPVSAWAAASWEKAQRVKVVDGSRPNAPLTREQYAVTLDRLGLLDGGV